MKHRNFAAAAISAVLGLMSLALSAKESYIGTDSTIVVRDYIANMEYVNGVLELVNFEGGYIDMTGESPRYMYYETDHLGNVRAVVDEDGNVCQVNHYYPYGDLFDDARDISSEGSGNMRLFGGKEYSEDTGLHDFEARYADTRFGRFTTIDPLAEKCYSVSPYSYCAGDPVNRVDPSGESWYFSKDVEDFLTYINDDDDRIYMLSQEQISNVAGDVSLYSLYRSQETTFGQLMIDDSLSNETVQNVYSTFYSHANQMLEGSSSVYCSMPSIKVSDVTGVSYKGRTIFPAITTDSIKGDLTVYRHNYGHEWNGYDMINVLSHELKHRIDVRNRTPISEISADRFSIDHWSYERTSDKRKRDIDQHIKENM